MDLDAAMETPAARLRRQLLWAIEASSRAMCSLGPAWSEADNSDWRAYARKITGDLTRGETNDFLTLPSSAHTFVDLNNLKKLLHNRLFGAAKRAKEAGHINPRSISAYIEGMKKHVMAGKEGK